MKGKLFIGLMYSDLKVFEKAKSELVNAFGEIDDSSAEYDFSFTDYYSPEMGSGLKKRFVSFSKLILREDLADIRLKTGEIEKKLSSDGKRKVNIDPGYVTKGAVFIASVKDRAHKVYLGKGVFVDMNLVLKKKSAEFFDWTFADYKQDIVQEFFHRVRKGITE